MTKIKVALFDMAATTVDDMVKKSGLEQPLPLVIAAYQDAFKAGKVEMPYDELNMCRGRDKLEVFREKVAKYRTDLDAAGIEHLANKLHDDEFVPALLSNVGYMKEMKGTSECFEYLKDNKVFVATGSGFPKVVVDAINKELEWKEKGLVDFGTCGQTAGKGRPHPNMINETLFEARYFNKITNGTDLSEIQDFDYSVVLKVGDTVKDIQEGNSVGATTIAVSSGTQPVDKLVEANPLVVLPSIEAVAHYLQRHRLI